MVVSQQSPLEINRHVRRILVSRWIDLGRISIHTVKTTVYVRGWLEKLPGADAAITSEYLEGIYRKIQQIPGISHVQIEFENWNRLDGGNWVSTSVRTEEARKLAQSEQQRKDVYDVGRQ